jgi:hypothetical protein
MTLYSVVYEVATGKLLEIGPPDSDWGFSVHAPHTACRREDPLILHPDVAASRAKFKVMIIDADILTAEALWLISTGMGGDGLNKTWQGLKDLDSSRINPAGKDKAITVIALSKIRS